MNGRTFDFVLKSNNQLPAECTAANNQLPAECAAVHSTLGTVCITNYLLNVRPVIRQLSGCHV